MNLVHSCIEIMGNESAARAEKAQIVRVHEKAGEVEAALSLLRNMRQDRRMIGYPVEGFNIIAEGDVAHCFPDMSCACLV